MVRRGSDDNIIYSRGQHRGGYIVILASSLPNMQAMLEEVVQYSEMVVTRVFSLLCRMCLDTVDVYGKIKSYLNIICAQNDSKTIPLWYSSIVNKCMHAQNNQKE